jgi:hypothetical protein
MPPYFLHNFITSGSNTPELRGPGKVNRSSDKIQVQQPKVHSPTLRTRVLLMTMTNASVEHVRNTMAHNTQLKSYSVLPSRNHVHRQLKVLACKPEPLSKWSIGAFAGEDDDWCSICGTSTQHDDTG